MGKRPGPARLPQAFKVLNGVRARQAINNLQVWLGEGVYWRWWLLHAQPCK